MRARLSDSSASSGSEPESERGGGEGAKSRGARDPPSRRASAGEESAMGPAEASRSGSGPRGRRLRRRHRLCFLFTGAADGGAAGAAGWRQQLEGSVLAWRAPPPRRPAFAGAPSRGRAGSAPAARRPTARLTQPAGTGEALRCKEAGGEAGVPKPVAARAESGPP